MSTLRKMYLNRLVPEQTVIFLKYLYAHIMLVSGSRPEIKPQPILLLAIDNRNSTPSLTASNINILPKRCDLYYILKVRKLELWVNAESALPSVFKNKHIGAVCKYIGVISAVVMGHKQIDSLSSSHVSPELSR